jgi:ABC-type Mn2+/Zn2+ transport system ATPase subunit
MRDVLPRRLTTATTETRVAPVDYVGAMDSSAPLLTLEHMGCGYGAEPVIDDVSVSIGPTDFVGIVGPSGGGKTTVLRAMLGVVAPLYGEVRRRPGLRIGYVPQVETIDWSFPVTVFEVVAMSISRSRFRRLSDDDRSRVRAVIDRIGLEGVHDRHISRLSGGQQQRVFIARALAHRPELLVLDEPASGVDVATRHELLHLLADLHRGGLPIVLTTHDINGLAAHLPRLICFNRTVIADGPPEEVLHPYVLERTYGAPMDVLQHGGMPVVLEHRGHGPHVTRSSERTA